MINWGLRFIFGLYRTVTKQQGNTPNFFQDNLLPTCQRLSDATPVAFVVKPKDLQNLSLLKNNFGSIILEMYSTPCNRVAGTPARGIRLGYKNASYGSYKEKIIYSVTH